jgi:hypothetical protein
METVTETDQKRGVITGKEGGPIELDKAVQWTANHRLRHPKGTVSQFFGQEILNRLLNQPGSLGIRFYYANSQELTAWQKFFVAIGNFFIKVVANADGEKRVIITSVLENGEDLLPSEGSQQSAMSSEVQTFKLMAAAPVVGDQSMPCPGTSGCPSNALSGG